MGESAPSPPLVGLRSAGERRLLRAAFALVVLVLAAGLANLLVGAGGEVVGDLIRGWASVVVYGMTAAIVVFRAVRVTDRRPAWILLAIGLTLYGAGNVVWMVWYDHLEAPPIPSISDGLWLTLYPLSYVGLVLLAREKGRSLPAGVWLDGIIAGLGFAALGAAVVFVPVLDSATGSTSAVMTNLAYPVADLLLAALVVGLLALRGWRIDRGWALLGGGFMALYVADSMYLLRVADGSAQTSLVPNLFYLSGVVLLAFAAWQPRGAATPSRVERWSVLIIPAIFIVTAIGLLLYDHFSRLGGVALSLATLTLIAAMVRTALTFRDVRSLAATRREAATDDLTALPNRRALLRHIDGAVASAAAERDGVALLLVDLDEFKKLNDTLGHHAGDRLLQLIGPRLVPVLRDGDLLARLGGDEFGVLLDAPCTEADALRVADLIGEALRAPFDIDGLHLRIAASIGIALYPSHSRDGRQLLRHADVAMYQAKQARSGHELYARERDTHSRDSLTLASELPTAIAAGQLEVHFQPQADAVSGDILAMEALVRWQHPERGMLPPVAFVPLAEQAGLMRDLTRAVMAQALTACRGWRDAGHDVHVAVNVSFTDLLDARFPAEVAAALDEHGLAPDALTIEVTESAIMSDSGRVGDVLARLGALGVAISLDDFGTGYSSLIHLRNLPVREVKIDRSFVARMLVDPTDEAIVRSTIQLAHNLGMRAVAEGVEDTATWAALADLGCGTIQGYGLSRPLPAAAAGAFLVTPSVGRHRSASAHRAARSSRASWADRSSPSSRPAA
jgi:diguanylate cyclase (GGDEF)-like protein